MFSKIDGGKISHIKKWWWHVYSVPSVNDNHAPGWKSCVCSSTPPTSHLDPSSVSIQGDSSRVIHLPKTQDELQPISRGFAGLARHRAFFKAAGAIDGCHVRIKPPSGPDGQCYRNRKLFPSIILQAVCDHQGRFIDTYVGWPGSVHDSRVLRYSPLYRSSLYPPPGHFIFIIFNTHSPSSLPTRGQYKVWEPSASTAITPGHDPL